MDRNRFVKEGGDNVRTFIAIELPAPLRERLGHLETRFAAHASAIKWVRPDLLHLTVRFLGNVQKGRIAAVEEAVREAACLIAPFTLQLEGLGAFPNERTPRVIWVGIGGPGLVHLQALRDAVETRLERAGLAREERSFSPHLTLARVRETVSSGERRLLGETLARLRQAERIAGTFEVRNVVVMRSETRPTGPIYTPLATFELSREE